MPGGDGTGPWGTWVDCAPLYPDGGLRFGRRRFWQRGLGLGYRRFSSQPESTNEEELHYLKAEQESAEKDLADIKKRLEELEKG